MKPDSAAGIRLEPAAAALLALILYIATGAPDVVWGDPAKLTLYVWRLNWSLDQSVHLGALLWAWPFSFLPLEPFALRITLASAAASAVAIGFFHAILLRHLTNHWAARTGTAVLALSHTFWFVSTITESYPVVMLSLAVAGWLLTVQNRPLAAGVAAGAGALANALTLFGTPAVIWWLWVRERKAGAPTRFIGGIAAGAAVPVLLLLPLLPAQPVSTGARWLEVFQTYTGWSLPAKNLPLLMAYLAYNFAGPALLLALHGWHGLARRERKAFLLFAATHYLFALFYLPQRAYLIPLPVYLAVAYLAARGADRWLGSHRGRTAALFMATLVFPVMVYSAAPIALASAPVPGVIRDAPFRDELAYYFRPWKHGEQSARHYIETIGSLIPKDAVITGDFTILTPLIYASRVEGWRPDCLLETVDHKNPDQIEALIEQHLAAGRRVFLLDDEPFYHPEKLRARWELVPAGAESLREIREPPKRTVLPPTEPAGP